MGHLKLCGWSTGYPLVPWFKEEIPRCSFITWLAMLARLPTRDRLLSWVLQVPDSCVLCDVGSESHQHLFFECPFAVGIWSRFCGRFIASSPENMQMVVLWCSQYQGIHSSQVKVLFRFILQVIVYYLWRERNARIFKNVSLSPLAFYKFVDHSLRDRLLSVPRDPSQALSLHQLYFWFVDPFS